jgi:hypothetical protein
MLTNISSASSSSSSSSSSSLFFGHLDILHDYNFYIYKTILMI